MFGSEDFVVLLLAAAIMLAAFAVIRSKRSRESRRLTDHEGANAKGDIRSQIWVSPHAMRRLEPVLDEITPDRSIEVKLRLVTRWHWLAAFGSPEKPKEQTTELEILTKLLTKIEAPPKAGLSDDQKGLILLGLIVLVAAYQYFGRLDTLRATVFLMVAVICACLLGSVFLWLMTFRWRYTYLVITNLFIAIVVLPPSKAFWISPHEYVYRLELIKTVNVASASNLVQSFTGPVGDVHAITYEQDKDDAVLDMKRLPRPAEIRNILNDVCAKLQAS